MSPKLYFFNERIQGTVYAYTFYSSNHLCAEQNNYSKKPQSRKRRIIANYRILYVQDHHWHMGEGFLTISHPIYLTQININNNMFGGQVLNQFSINLYRSFQQC